MVRWWRRRRLPAESRPALAPDDRVVISGIQRATPGQKVTAQPGTITPSEASTEVPVTTAPPAASATFAGSAD